MEGKFKCSQCGACCMVAGLTGMVPDRGDGSCVHLNDDNQCNIYETRPSFCRVKDKGIEHYKLNTLVCHELIDLLNLDEKYKIDISEYGENI